MASNYPPGVSANTRNAPWNQPDPADREVVDVEDELILEDEAAIFYRTTYLAYVVGVHQGYRETITEYGPEDSETEAIRLDVDRVIVRREGQPDITYLASSDDFEYLFDTAINEVEVEFMNDEIATIIDCDPPNNRDDGFVSAKANEYEVWYTQ